VPYRLVISAIVDCVVDVAVSKNAIEEFLSRISI
jgi:hypothetical protein